MPPGTEAWPWRGRPPTRPADAVRALHASCRAGAFGVILPRPRCAAVLHSPPGSYVLYDFFFSGAARGRVPFARARRCRGPPVPTCFFSHSGSVISTSVRHCFRLLGNCPLVGMLSPVVPIRNASIKGKERAVLWSSAAYMSAAWYIAAMKKPITITEFARMDGKARAQKLSPERRRQIASEAGKKVN